MMQSLIRRYGRSYGEFYYVNASVVEPQESLKTMLRMEKQYKVQNPNYVKDFKNSMIFEEWRRRVAEWAFSVADFYSMNRETVTIAISHIDRYLAKQPLETLEKTEFQLASVCSLFITCKLLEKRPITMEQILAMSGSEVTQEMVEEMETKLLETIEWRLYPPTPLCFIRLLLRYLAAPPKVINEIIDCTRYFTELSACDMFFVGYNSSTIAIASILNALNDNDIKVESQEHVLWLGRIKELIDIEINDDIKVCRVRLGEIYQKALMYGIDSAESDNETIIKSAIGPQENEKEIERRKQSPTCVKEVNSSKISNDSISSRQEVSTTKITEEKNKVSEATCSSALSQKRVQALQCRRGKKRHREN